MKSLWNFRPYILIFELLKAANMMFVIERFMTNQNLVTRSKEEVQKAYEDQMFCLDNCLFTLAILLWIFIVYV